MLRFLKSDLTYSLLAGFLVGAASLHFLTEPVERPALTDSGSAAHATAARSNG